MSGTSKQWERESMHFRANRTVPIVCVPCLKIITENQAGHRLMCVCSHQGLDEKLHFIIMCHFATHENKEIRPLCSRPLCSREQREAFRMFSGNCVKGRKCMKKGWYVPCVSWLHGLLHLLENKRMSTKLDYVVEEYSSRSVEIETRYGKGKWRKMGTNNIF